MAESVEKYCLTNLAQNAQVKAAISGCRAEGTLFVGSSMQQPWKQTGGNWTHSLRSRQVRWDDQSQYHQEIESVFVGGRLSFLLPPPAC